MCFLVLKGEVPAGRRGLRLKLEFLEAPVSDLSNAFAEGTNNKVKMVKRVMYGRCKLPILKAKLIGRQLEDVIPSTA